MAQDNIQGQVVDGSGNPVSGAIVELTRSYQSSPPSEEVVRRTTTDANGNYTFSIHPDSDGTTQEWHVAAYNYDGSAYVNSFNNPGVTADLLSNAIPDSGVSRWTFDDADTDSGTAIDMWGDNNGTINGTTTGVSGANQTYTTNEGYSFDGTDDSVVATIGSSYSAFSVALWYYLDSGSSNECLFSIDNGSGEVTLRVDSGNGYDLFDNGVANGGGGGEGSWIHVCVTVDTTSSDFEIYENGSSIITGSFNVDFGSGDLYFGERDVPNVPPNNLAGELDDPRLYDKQLTASEVSNLYNTGSISG